MKIATTQPKRIDDVAPDVPEPLRAIIRECMVTDKSKRLESFDRIVEELDAMMLDLAELDLRLKQPPRLESAPQADVLQAMHHSGDHPAPSSQQVVSSSGVAGPPSVPTSSSGTAAPNLGPAGPTRRTIAITVGMLAVGAMVFGIAAAFGRSDRDSRAAANAASQGAVLAASGAATAPRVPPSAAPAESSEVPLISVDSLPVATRNAPPKPNGSGVGRLQIVAGPSSCSVSIDGISRGNTPVTGIELSAGPHRIDCAPQNGKPKTVSVTIVEGASARYRFSFDE